jgi:pimeloyl-ACP methyl ester carboxylesterase
MGSHVQLAEVRTFYTDDGTGDAVLLLHPGGTDGTAMAVQAQALVPDHRVLIPDRRGHGRTPAVPGPLSFEAMTRDTIAFLEQVAGGPADLVGCSDGSVVALLTAVARPDLVRRLVLACGVWHFDGWLPGVELEDRHHVEPALTVAHLNALATPTLVMVGDRDEIRPEHTQQLYEALPDARLAVLPGGSHGFLVEQPERCNAMIRDFLAGRL